MISEKLFDGAFKPVELDDLKLCFILYLGGLLFGLLVVCYFTEFKQVLVRRCRQVLFRFKFLP